MTTETSITVDGQSFDTDARYTVDGWRGIAFYVHGAETERYWDESEGIYWDEPEERETGRVLVVMVGDDRTHSVDPDELTLLGDLDYCSECGQVGCTGDFRDREEQS